MGEISWLSSFKTVGGIQSGPVALWGFKLASNFWMPGVVFVKKQRTIERKKKRSKISGLESCCANRIYVLIGGELRPYGQKLVQFCINDYADRYAFRAFSVLLMIFCRKTQRTNAKSGRPKVADWKVAT